jgi:small subunit ribosomal protein S6
VAGPTGRAFAGGSAGSDRRSCGHATTSASTATSAAARATLRQRTRVCKGRSSGARATLHLGRRRGRFAPSLLSWPAAVASAYDLILLLDATAEDDARAKVLSDVEAAIGQVGGSVENKQDWGKKILAFKIRHVPEANYHLIQFDGPPTLPATLDRSLAINDVVLRHRLIHTPGGEPSTAPPPPAPAAEPAPELETETESESEPAQA